MKKGINKKLSLALTTFILFSSNVYANESVSVENSKDTVLTKSSLSRASVTSEWIYKTHDGRSYKNQSSTTSNSGSVWGSNFIRSRSGNLPGGTMGTHVNLYNSSGKVVRTSDWYYEPSTSAGFTRLTPSYKASSGTFYTKSTNHLYTRSNGKYVPFSSIPSPKLSLRSLEITLSEEELNERDHLYKTKNMIPAVGENDIEGYISIDDLYGEIPESPKDAIMRQLVRAKSSKQYRMIPLYHTDGETIIGEYRIDFNLDGVENIIVE